MSQLLLSPLPLVPRVARVACALVLLAAALGGISWRIDIGIRSLVIPGMSPLYIELTDAPAFAPRLGNISQRNAITTRAHSQLKMYKDNSKGHQTESKGNQLPPPKRVMLNKYAPRRLTYSTTLH